MAVASEYHEPRRRDRAVEDEAWIVQFLERAATGTLATVEAGQPFINSNLFVYDAERRAVYLHTARKGRTRSNVEGDQRACFSVSSMGRLLPADTALEMSAEYAGVVVFGPARVVEDRDEAEHALYLLIEKYFPHLTPGSDYRRITAEELDRTSVFRLDVERWMGKRKEVGPFDGAFLYGWPPRSDGRPKRQFQASVDEALAAIPQPDGRRFVELFRHGSLQLEAYSPSGEDPQAPHSRDEVYCVVRGSGDFYCGGSRRAFGSGDLLFVPAGVEHRFESFTDDFFTWVVFYGPEGGEEPA